METPLNFHHLKYFWAVANDGNLTRTAARLHVAQSALSAQIRQLEEHLGQALFRRVGRRLELTEAGKIALRYAEEIFSAGGELVATLKEGRKRHHLFRVGAVATLSRNFQSSFVKPLLGQKNVRLQLSSGSLDELCDRLQAHDLDVVLSNHPVGEPFRSVLLARQSVSLVSSKVSSHFRFPQDLHQQSLVLPGAASQLRSEFDALCMRLGVKVRVLAEVDDMATLRLLARDSEGLALVPSVVVRDELQQGRVHEWCVVPGLTEAFYALTLERKYPHPLMDRLMDRSEEDMLSG